MTSMLEHAHERILQSLLAGAADADSPDARLFGTLVAARACRNELALLGLSPARLSGLLARQFPHLGSDDAAALVSAAAIAPLPTAHAQFVATLHARLMQDAHCAVARDDADCVATIIAHACLRPDHLWRDLGLDGRAAVSALLDRYFPALAARNVANLRWKKFLAQEAAASLGLPPGPAPGCPGCEDFGFCFPAGR
ncbi:MULTISPECIES: nitrogen fixation protein NifQ [unclassified Burkholderia]|uniref:nitrogen fixation protein NifQ n=1 Tax=unclassified Burkholderia TaxID=2613784 RepID=UPI0005CEDA56|nr:MULTISPECIES: nitrogen fixation protein NifQ [unclassified Burkholderia]RQR74456.1 nitrogen fixation protein NifQ [Burkholderia sp. Bp9011]RQR85016.1 nitrogen fixation protein NifQ [Burkholderia sp. Bp9010]RQR99026.1 nitrogen fixation protein NifQ [Burkholderia sp. Bp8991]RQS66788.1 nitrogen fixation protein NifQ [Burkholderia sp. Bp8977]TGN99536.1 nitrogen fixation protein NifQ [Burkholderia sp. USMB20]